jgi:hypothetical protein
MAKSKPTTRLGQLQVDIKVLARNLQRAHKWQADVNQELRERMGEVEATLAELVQCEIERQAQEAAAQESSRTQRGSRRGTKSNSDFALPAFSEASPNTNGSTPSTSTANREES